MSKHIENEYKKIPDALYHYTSRKGFLGIIKTKQIWASHIRFMNDLKEQILALEILERNLAKQLKNLNQNIDCKSLMDEVTKKIKAICAEKNVFVFSFTEVSDDLNQWRGYANDTPGIQLKFNIAELQKTFDFETDIETIKEKAMNFGDLSERKRVLFLHPCIYDETAQDNCIIKIIKDSIRGVPSCNVAKLAEVIAKNIFIAALFIKHNMFKSEKEWRLIIIHENSYKPLFSREELEEKLDNSKNDFEKEMYEDQLDMYDFNKGRIKEDSEIIDFNVGKSMIIPHYKLSIPLNIISEIMIGACPDRESVKESIVYLLSKNGFSKNTNNMVTETACPYRNW